MEHLENLTFLAAQPRRIIIGFVKETAYIGTYTSTPYEFANNDVRSIKLKIGDNILQQNINAGENYYAEMLFWLHRNLGWQNNPGTFSVSMNSPDTITNTSVFAFDCSNSMTGFCEDFYSTSSKSTMFSIEALFGSAIAQNLVCVVLCEIDSILNVASDRDAMITYPPVDE